MGRWIILIILSISLILIIAAGTALKLFLKKRLEGIDGANGVVKESLISSGNIIAMVGEEKTSAKGRGKSHAGTKAPPTMKGKTS